MIEQIEWITDGSKPDEELTVLVKTGSGMVDTGFVEGGEWRWAACAALIQSSVIGYAELPKGPEAPKRGRGRKS